MAGRHLHQSGRPVPGFLQGLPFGATAANLHKAGSLEGEDQYFKRYQEKAIQSGAIVEYVIAPGEAHSFMGNAAQLQRTKDIMRMLFDE